MTMAGSLGGCCCPRQWRVPQHALGVCIHPSMFLIAWVLRVRWYGQIQYRDEAQTIVVQKDLNQDSTACHLLEMSGKILNLALLSDFVTFFFFKDFWNQAPVIARTTTHYYFPSCVFFPETKYGHPWTNWFFAPVQPYDGQVANVMFPKQSISTEEMPKSTTTRNEWIIEHS